MTVVLQVHWAALPVTGGVEVHCDALCRQLTDLGADVELVSGTEHPVRGGYEPALTIGGPVDAAGRSSLLDRCLAADVVHWHNPQWHKPELTAWVSARLTERNWPGRLVFDIHNIDEQQSSWQFLAQLSDSYVVHSDFVRAELAARLPDARLVLLPLALTTDREAYELPRPAGFVALQPTRLTTWKGSDLSLRAVLGLLAEGADLALVHAGTQHLVWPSNIDQRLLDAVEPWQQNGRVQFVHYRPAQSWDAVAAADVVLHPTADRGAHGEPFSLSTAQAVICGRPVIVSDSGNLPRLVEGYSLARVVPAGDADALTEALRDVIQAPPAMPGPADRRLAQALSEQFAAAGRQYLDRYLDPSPALTT